MNRKQRIKKLLENFNECEIEVVDNSYKHAGHNDFDGNQSWLFEQIGFCFWELTYFMLSVSCKNS